MNVNVKKTDTPKLMDLDAGDVFMIDGDRYEDVYMMTDNDFIDGNIVNEDELVVIELDNGHLYVYNKNLAVRKANVAEVNVEM
jgi:hypothetical protein